MSDWTSCQYDQIEHIEKTYTFKKYSRAVAFCNAIAGLAEAQIHHPRMVIEWGKVTVAWGTHESDNGSGVMPKDRAMAVRSDDIFNLLQQPVE